MKAWKVYASDGYPSEGATLVWAATRNQARHIGRDSAWEWEYRYCTAVRAPAWDGIRSEPGYIDDNDELPEGAESFYSEECY